MKTYVFWTAIAGPQYSVHEDESAGWAQAEALIKRFKHGKALLYVPEDGEWTEIRKGIRGGLTACEIPEDEVPKVYRLLLTLEG